MSNNVICNYILFHPHYDIAPRLSKTIWIITIITGYYHCMIYALITVHRPGGRYINELGWNMLILYISLPLSRGNDACRRLLHIEKYAY